jgi:hypothetical protein
MTVDTSQNASIWIYDDAQKKMVWKDYYYGCRDCVPLLDCWSNDYGPCRVKEVVQLEDSESYDIVEKESTFVVKNPVVAKKT